MESGNIEKLLFSLGCSQIKRKSKGVASTCPLAPWNHSGGRDKHPSFFVYEDSSGISGCRCQGAGCGFHGSLRTLLYKIERMSGQDFSKQHLFLADHDKISLERQMKKIESTGSYYSKPAATTSSKSSAWTGGKDYSDPLVFAEAHPPLPQSAVEHVDKMISLLNDEAIEYLTGPDRRFTMETIKKWKLGWHPGPRRISVPQYDHIGRLVNIGGRYLPYWTGDLYWIIPEAEREDRVPKWMHSLGFDREVYLFGEDWFELSNDGTGTVFIVEGAFDVIYLDQCGVKNVAAVNGSYVNRPQVEKLVKWFDSAVVLMDGDEAGQEAAMRLKDQVGQRMHAVNYVIPGGRDPNQMTDEEVADLKERFAR